MAHRIVGFVVVLGWLWLVLHLGHYAPQLVMAADHRMGRSGRGVLIVLLMPLLAAALLIAPGFFARRFSPYSHMTGEPVLDIGLWRVAGYVALLVSWGLWSLFT